MAYSRRREGPNTSADSAARYLKARAQGRSARGQRLGGRPSLTAIPVEWQLVERSHPGAYQAWVRQVNLPAAMFVLASSKLATIAMDRRCADYRAHVDGCMCKYMCAGAWVSGAVSGVATWGHFEVSA